MSTKLPIIACAAITRSWTPERPPADTVEYVNSHSNRYRDNG
jgi:hypothetical protein